MNPNPRHKKIEMRASETEKKSYEQLGIHLGEPFTSVLRRLANREVRRHGIGGNATRESRHCPGAGVRASRGTACVRRMRSQV